MAELADELWCCQAEQVTCLNIPGMARQGSAWSLALACLSHTWAPLCCILKPREEHELFSLRLLRDKRQNVHYTSTLRFHYKNTIKGCVLRSWAWKQFPPTLLQHESWDYCNCSLSRCLADDAARSRGRNGKPLHSTVEALKSFKEENDMQAHMITSTKLPDGFAA